MFTVLPPNQEACDHFVDGRLNNFTPHKEPTVDFPRGQDSRRWVSKTVPRQAADFRQCFEFAFEVALIEAFPGSGFDFLPSFWWRIKVKPTEWMSMLQSSDIHQLSTQAPASHTFNLRSHRCIQLVFFFYYFAK